MPLSGDVEDGPIYEPQCITVVRVYVLSQKLLSWKSNPRGHAYDEWACPSLKSYIVSMRGKPSLSGFASLHRNRSFAHYSLS